MYVGIDGCRSGWVVAAINDQQQLTLQLIEKLLALINLPAAVAYIDIPLHFAQREYRPCEVAAQRLLGPHKRASIFLTPQREAVYAPNFAEANHINRVLMGKGVSIQAWNIFEKIKEAVAFTASGSSSLLHEAHPELSFCFLNNQQPLLSKKSSLQGVTDRMNLIEAASAQHKQAIESFLLQTKRKDVKPDDVLDATVLAIRAASPHPLAVLPRQATKEGGNIFF